MPRFIGRARGRTAAPAKINLGLRIVGRRSDGYHLLESAFAPIDWTDRVTVRVQPASRPRVELEFRFDRAFRGPPPPGGDGEQLAADGNLASRAARAFLDASGLRAEVRVRLRKLIPIGAGLGGGSSDAGAVLRLLRRACPHALPPQQLAATALQLGADVPFFLDPQPAWVEGVGERIEPIRDFPTLAVVLLVPAPSLSTAEVFGRFAASDGAALTPPAGGRSMPEPPGTRRRELLAALTAARSTATPVVDPLANDLEAIATQLHPRIRVLREELAVQGASCVGMSGSGPTLFGVFPDRASARRAVRRGTWGEDVWVRVARTLAGGAGATP